MTVEELEAEELLELPDRAVPSLMDLTGGVAPVLDVDTFEEEGKGGEDRAGPSSPGLPPHGDGR